MRRSSVIVLLSILVFSSISISGQEDYRDEKLEIFYEGEYWGENDLIINTPTGAINFSNATDLEVLVTVYEPSHPASEISVVITGTTSSTTIETLDHNITIPGLVPAKYPGAFGFIADTTWEYMKDIMHELSLEEAVNDTEVHEGSSPSYISNGTVIETYNFNLSYLTNYTYWAYEVQTGILLVFGVEGENLFLNLELSEINGSDHWFDQIYNLQFDTADDSANNVGPIIGLIIVSIIILLGYLFVKSGKLSPSSPSASSAKYTQHKQRHGTSRTKSRSVKKNPEKIKLDGYGKVRICCNQTARLGEIYCPCGRAIPEKLQKYYN